MRRLHLTKLGLIQYIFDILVWEVALLASILIRLNFTFIGFDLLGFVYVGLIVATLQLLFGTYFGLYSGRYRFGSFEEVLLLSKTVIAVGILA